MTCARQWFRITPGNFNHAAINISLCIQNWFVLLECPKLICAKANFVYYYYFAVFLVTKVIDNNNCLLSKQRN